MNVHRENQPPLDLAPIRERITARQSYTASRLVQYRDVIDADTEMMLALVVEITKLRAACDALREVLGPLRKMPVAP